MDNFQNLYDRIILNLANLAQKSALTFLRIDRIDGIAICDGSSSQAASANFLKSTQEVLALIKTMDPRRYRRICRQFDYISNWPLVSRGAFGKELRICYVDHTRCFATPDLQWNLRSYAYLLVHEATHGVIEEKGVPYNKENWQRIEKLCHREGYRFALHFGVDWAERNIGPFSPDPWKPYWEPQRDQWMAARRRIQKFFQSKHSPW